MTATTEVRSTVPSPQSGKVTSSMPKIDGKLARPVSDSDQNVARRRVGLPTRDYEAGFQSRI